MSLRSGSRLELGWLSARSPAIAVGDGRDLDLARLQLLGLGDLETEDAVLEGRLRLVRLEASRQRHRPAEVAPADLLEDIAALLGGPLIGRLAGDGDRAVFHRDVHVVRLDARQGRLDGHGIRIGRDVERQSRTVEAAGEPAEWPEVVIEVSVHRLAHRQHVTQRRRTAHDRHGSYTSRALVPGTSPGM